jgi:hypothetical protein
MPDVNALDIPRGEDQVCGHDNADVDPLDHRRSARVLPTKNDIEQGRITSRKMVVAY